MVTSHRADLWAPWIYEEIRKKFLHGLSIDPKLPQCIFISRKDAPDRKLINETAIFETAKKYFPELTCVELSGLSFEDQLELFKGAKLIIGPHGQSFRNVLFSNNALCIQLVQGMRTDTNEYRYWADNYSYLVDPQKRISVRNWIDLIIHSRRLK